MGSLGVTQAKKLIFLFLSVFKIPQELNAGQLALNKSMYKKQLTNYKYSFQYLFSLLEYLSSPFKNNDLSDHLLASAGICEGALTYSASGKLPLDIVNTANTNLLTVIFRLFNEVKHPELGL